MGTDGEDADRPPTTKSDIPRLLEMGHAFFAESSYGEIAGIDETSLRTTLIRMMESDDAVVPVAEVVDPTFRHRA